MKKLFIFFIALTSCANLWAGQLSADNVRLAVPDDWHQVKDAQPPVVLMAMAPAENNFAKNVVVTKETLPKGFPADGASYKKASKQYILNAFVAAKVIEDKTNSFVIENAYGNGIKLYQMFVFAVKNGIGYTLTFSSLPDAFNTSRKQFNQIATSFKVD
ncbi:MAG: DUF1795 domain-containing protein [Elusimicrobiota bacterium]|nr:DUF1795 domain-containing protein [Elusimicrobiota bacterium]